MMRLSLNSLNETINLNLNRRENPIMKKSHLTLLIAVLLATSSVWLRAAQTFTFQEGVNGYAGTKDTHIRFGSPDRDDGALDSLNPDKSDGGGEVHGLMRFDDIFGTKPGQIPAGSTILQASLTLYLVNPGNSPGLHRMLIPWDESTTWNTFDAVNQDGITGDGVEAAVEPDATFDVPSAGIPYFKEIPLLAKTLQDWLDGKTKNYGWGFIPSSTDGIDFDSSESAVVKQRPLLTVVIGKVGDAFVRAFTSTSVGFAFELEDGTLASGLANAVNQNSLSVSVDGAKITPTVTRSGNVTTVRFSPGSAFVAGSTHQISLSFSDTATPPKTLTDERTFTVASYQTLPASYAVTGVDTTKPGFKARVHQISAARRGDDQNDLTIAEKQLDGTLINPDTGTKYDNEADLALAKNGIFEVPGVINWNQDAPAAVGNFSDTSTPPATDVPIPGIPGINGSLDNIAAEITTFLDLKAGFYRFGVNSDDGFRLTVGPGASDVFATTLGLFDGGRGSADSVFEFAVEKDGTYPFRLAWWEGGGGANLEFFSVDPATGEKILINDTANAKAIKAYREGPATAFAPRAGLQTMLAIDDKTMWRYDRSGADLGMAWREKGYNDGAWPQGAALIAQETGTTTDPIRTEIDRNNDAGEYVETFYYRAHFNISGDPKAVQLRLRHVLDDGGIFYLNGVEVHRFGYQPGVAVDANNTSVAGHENQYAGPYDIATASLVAGDNVLAVEVHQSGTGSSDTVFGAELFALIGAAPALPVKFTGASRSAGNIVLEWTGTGTLQSADGVTGPWADVANAKSPFSAAISGGGKFYRLKQ